MILRWIYTLLLVVVFPLFMMWFLLQMLFKNKYRRGFGERFGRIKPCRESECRDHERIWIHAASVGEVQVAEPLVRQLEQDGGKIDYVITCNTDTGYETAMSVFPDAMGVSQAPFDFPVLIDRFLNTVKPHLFLIVETEIWPNMIHAAWTRNIPVALVNGRISDSSFPGYRRIRFMLRRTLQKISFAGMQSETDAHRLKALGSPSECTVVTGNVKYDRDYETEPSGALKRAIDTMGWTSRNHIIVAGSTHPDDEEELLIALGILKSVTTGPVRMIIAPRHLERTGELEARLKGLSIRYRKYSMVSNQDLKSRDVPMPDILILDKMGELAGAYGLGIMGFVGGTFQNTGGHNLLEPAAHGIPVFFGPNIQNCRETARLLIESNGGVQVQNGTVLAEHIQAFLSDPTRRRDAGTQARNVILKNRGAVKRHIEHIIPLLRESVERMGGTTSGQRRFSE